MSIDNITSTTKTRVYIGGEATAKTVAEYAALPWVEIGSIPNIGDIGDEHEEITLELYGSGRRIKRAGVADAGTAELEVARDVFDAGQTAAREAAKTRKPQAFKIVLDDRPLGGGTPTAIYFDGVVLSARNVFGGPNEILKTSFTTSITSEPLEVPAAA